MDETTQNARDALLRKITDQLDGPIAPAQVRDLAEAYERVVAAQASTPRSQVM